MVWSGLEKALNYGFDNWDAVNIHFLVCKAILAWWQTNKQPTNQLNRWTSNKPVPDQQEGSLLQKQILQKTFFGSNDYASFFGKG